MKQPKHITGMMAFGIVWIGQAISLLGSEMSGFAMAIWVYKIAPEETRVTAFALMGFLHVVPLLLMSPFAGAIVDRSNRKLMMIVSDLAAGLTTLGILLLYATGQLQLWHLYFATAIAGAFQTFQWPAYSAAISLMVEKKHYARTHALMNLAGSTTGIFAPMVAGGLIGMLEPNGILVILLIDVVTFVIAIGGVLIVTVPQPQISEEGRKGQGSLLKEAVYGFKFIFERRSLLGLQLVFLTGNFFSSLAFTVLTPMVLTRSNNNSLVLGSVQTAGAIGGVTGGLLIGAWGGPKRKVYGVLGGWALTGLLGACVIGLGQSLPVWAAGVFFASLIGPLIDSSNQAIWQAKVAPDVQGRVFAIRRLIAWFVTPIATLTAGPLADFVMEPGMQREGVMTRLFGYIVGSGAGTGMALIILVSGVMMTLVGVGAYLFFPVVRNAEDLLPDHQALIAGDLPPDHQALIAGDLPPDLDQKLQALLAERAQWINAPQSPEREQALKRIAEALRKLGNQRSKPVV